MKTAVALCAVLFAFGAAMTFGAFLSYHHQHSGTRVQAKVSSCTGHRGKYSSGIHCSGTWVVGGPLFDGGRVVVGSIENATRGDIGKTLEVRLHGDSATKTGDIGTPIALLVCGLIAMGLGGWGLVRMFLRGGTSNAA